MQRHAQLIGIKPDQIAEYERLHAAVWPEVLATIRDCNIRNYSIFRHGGMLFAYFEYVGHDFNGDMARMAADPKTQEWWALCKPMQQPLDANQADEWWASIAEVFHTD
jgi:L-rhamnose mutarotase